MLLRVIQKEIARFIPHVAFHLSLLYNHFFPLLLFRANPRSTGSHGKENRNSPKRRPKRRKLPPVDAVS